MFPRRIRSHLTAGATVGRGIGIPTVSGALSDQLSTMALHSDDSDDSLTSYDSDELDTALGKYMYPTDSESLNKIIIFLSGPDRSHCHHLEALEAVMLSGIFN